jgi:WS/DGAT/MGAT family acyltransferase
VPRLAAAFGKLFARLGSRSEPGLVVPFADSPRSVLNGRVREKRRFATQQFALERLRALAKAGGGTLNDVVLALCGGALRRFLLERDALPARSLTAGIPVSVRPPDDDGTGNEITFIIATLGTDIADAGERFAAIRASVQRGKAHVQSLPRQAMAQYTVMLMAPTMALMLSGIGGRVRPMFNVTISNVPGPDKPLFFRGAELLALYPASIVTHGLALNITCHSCAGAMNFGFTGCHSSVPSLQRLAVYLAQALEELEAALATPARQPAQPKPKVRKVAAPATPARPARATRATRATRAAKATKAASPTRRRQAAAAPPARPKKPRASAATRSAAG